MNVRAFITCLCLLWANWGFAQGFADLGTPAPGFAVPNPETVIVFPRDEGPHPDFRNEWWYLTANLTDASGQAIGVQWSLFRRGLTQNTSPGWKNGQVWMAQAAITTSQTHHFAERFARGGTGQAGVRALPFDAWMDEWRLMATKDGWNLKVIDDQFSVDLQIAQIDPPILQGQMGYSVKSSDGQASHYYSRPFLQLRGQVEIGGDVHKVSGQGWYDREWSSQPLSDDQIGWDWLEVSLNDGSRIMAARVRGAEPFEFGSFTTADGHVTSLDSSEFSLQPIDSQTPPNEWALSVPGRDVDVTIVALNSDSWTGNAFRYWEGPVIVSGTHSGQGYLEMTGYR